MTEWAGDSAHVPKSLVTPQGSARPNPLIREMREHGLSEPVFIYASSHALAREGEVLMEGGKGVTASPTQLFRMLRGVGRFPQE